MSVYSGTKFAVRAISEGLCQEAGDKLRVTVIIRKRISGRIACNIVQICIILQMISEFPKISENET